MDLHRRIAFVPPRYGTDVVGGAEASLREVAHGFAGRGWEVDVLTTQARDHFTWANELPAGPLVDGKVTVTRFPVVRDTPGHDRALVEQLLADGETPTIDEQERWINDGLRSPELFHHVLDHAESYRAIVVSPYMFWTTFACGQVAPDRTILRPCLHDEPYARLELFEPLFTGSAGRWLFTDPERDVLASLYPLGDRTAVVGDGVTVPAAYDPEGFRRRHGLGDRRFVLYGGRREGGKGWDELLAGFAEAARGGVLDLALVTFGVGEVVAPPDVADRVVDLGRISDRDRDDAFAAAGAYLQPSTVESFSRTVMEAWLAGTPVVANAGSAVVRWHCERSGAGITYADRTELVECLRLVAEAPDLVAALAKPGRDYVLDSYSWPAALDRMEATIEAWL
ncbi:MAG: glycosyltransferase family 1 protein [Acidimicrobiales bacterium]|nr:glycosyltransferase family 1 protein [Acidimicrobiales bacterium]